MATRAVLYLRVSTDGQTVENRRQALQAAAETRGWEVVAEFADEGISGAKGRDRRPQLDAMLKTAVRGKFDVVMCWAVDRLGRSLPDLIGTMQELHGARVDLFMLQQGLDTTTPFGRAAFQMMGVFAEFELAMTKSRIAAGLARARAETREQRLAKGKKLGFGRPKTAPSVERAIRAGLAEGKGILKVAREVGVGSGTVQRVRREMVEATSEEAA